MSDEPEDYTSPPNEPKAPKETPRHEQEPDEDAQDVVRVEDDEPAPPRRVRQPKKK